MLVAAVPLVWRQSMKPISLSHRAGRWAIAVLGLFCSLAVAHDPGPGSASAMAVTLQEGASLSVVGRVSILDVVVPMGPGSERIYALVAADGTATRIEPGALGAAL